MANLKRLEKIPDRDGSPEYVEIDGRLVSLQRSEGRQVSYGLRELQRQRLDPKERRRRRRKAKATRTSRQRNR